MAEELKMTEAQALAVGTRGKSLLVSAAAGSGKTWVLTRRLLKYIEEGKDIDSFVIITFTKAAAAELKGRISEELAKLGEVRQSALVRRAPIGTIHSFCGSILRSYAHEAGLSPDFKVISDERAAAAKSEILDRTLEDFYANMSAHEGFKQLVDTVGSGRDDGKLRKVILDLDERMQSHPRPAKWADEVRAMYAAETAPLDGPWGGELKEEWTALAASAAAEMKEAVSMAAHKDPVVFEKQINFLDAESEHFANLSAGLQKADLTWDGAAALLVWEKKKLIQFSAKKLDPAVAEEYTAVKDNYKAARDAAYAKKKKIEEALSGGEDAAKDAVRAVAPAMNALLDITLEFDRRYRENMHSNGYVDYSDLEHLTVALLTDEDGKPNERARSIAGKYTEIMVDEYQDVSRVQELIFSAVSKDGKNLFTVGDVKQAIYRFRLADPGIFLEREEKFRSDPEAGELVILNKNYRSRAEILEASNTVFRCCMTKELGDVDYDENASLHFGAEKKYEAVTFSEPDRPQVLLWDMKQSEAEIDAEDDEDTYGEQDERPDRLQMEAEGVALKIRELVESRAPVADGDRTRPLDYGDVAILLRAANKDGPAYRNALIKYGIPVISSQGGSFFESPEVEGIIALLEILDNPRRDIPMLAALRSPYFAFSPDELAAISGRKRTETLFEALTKRAQEDAKCAAFLATYDMLRSAAVDLSATELISLMLTTLNARAVCEAMTDGERRRMNLVQLTELAGDFENDGYYGLHKFVIYLDHFRKSDNLPPIAGACGSAVRIMSIHKSKGLEFPAVFICGMGKQFNGSDSRETVLVHPVLGLGPSLVDPEKRIRYPTVARRAISNRNKNENLSEEMRLLYVAMTRAEEYLFISASVNDAEASLAKAEKRSRADNPADELKHVRAPIDWILTAMFYDKDRAGAEGRRPSMELSTLALEGAVRPVTAEKAHAEADEEAYGELCRNLAFVYPYGADSELPSKVTATELKTYAQPEDDGSLQLAPRDRCDFRLPDFMRAQRPPTGAEKGIATHLVLQYMDFKAAESRERIETEIERLRSQKFISDRQASAVDPSAIEKLFSSALGERIRNAESMRREFRFSVLCPASELFDGVQASDGEVLLQGVVDLCIIENGELTIIDYKTDRADSPADIDAKTELYGSQITAYAAALGRIFGMPVKECILYFLSAGETRTVRMR